MTHTPGPWINEGDTSVYALQQDGWRKGEPLMVNRFYVQVQTGFAGGKHTPKEELIANARLIAAAPDLLAACEEFVRKCENGSAHSKRSYAQMKAAIEKVKG